MGIDELIAAETAAAEANMDAPVQPGARVTRGHGRSRTLQVRLTDDELALLTELAQGRGIPTSTLARDLLMGQLQGAGESPQAVIARLRSDLEVLAAQVA